VLDTALNAELSGPGRLHDLCVTLEAASPGEMKSRGAGLDVDYGFAPTPFGQALIAETARGLCHLSFVNGEGSNAAGDLLESEWPNAKMHRADQRAGELAERILLALSTFPDRETAHRISNQLVTEKLAACANILPTIESIYRWKEKIETGNEMLVFFKLSEDRQSAFQEKLRSLHPYEVPEIIFVPATSGLPEYLHWVIESCAESRPL
jgi:periplasmic divalent cation tolerance protein